MADTAVAEQEPETVYHLSTESVIEPMKSAVRSEMALLAEAINKSLAEKRTTAIETKEVEDKAGLDESIVSKVKSSTNMIVPVAVGGFGAIVASELIDGLMINQTKTTRGITKAVGAFAVYTWGKNIPFMGNTGKNVAAALLLFDALRDLTPISEWASQLANKVSKAAPVGGLGDQAGRDVMGQARRIAAAKGVGI